MLMICLSIHIRSLKIYFINCVNEDINKILNHENQFDNKYKKDYSYDFEYCKIHQQNISYVGLHIIVGDAQIPYSDSVKYLGLTIFGTFSFASNRNDI